MPRGVPDEFFSRVSNNPLSPPQVVILHLFNPVVCINLLSDGTVFFLRLFYMNMLSLIFPQNTGHTEKLGHNTKPGGVYG